MGFFHNRFKNQSNDDTTRDEDDADFHSIFEIEDLDSLDVGDVENRISDTVLLRKGTTISSENKPNTPTTDTGHKNSGIMIHDKGICDIIDNEEFDHQLKVGINSAIVWNNKGVVLSRVGEYDAAIEAFERALSTYPNYSNAWNNLGVVLSRMGKFDAAIEAFDKALILPPSYPTQNANMVILKAVISSQI